MPVILSPFACRLLQAVIFLIVPTAIVAPHGVVWGILISGALGLYYSLKQPLPHLPKPLPGITLALPLWGTVTSFWAEYPWISFIAGVKVLILFILGLYWCRLVSGLASDVKKSFLNAFIAGLLIGIIFLLVDIWLGNPWQMFWYKTSAKAFAQGTLIISLAFWPTALWVFRQNYSVFKNFTLLSILALTILYIFFNIDCDTSFIGLLIGIFIFLTTLWLPRLTCRGLRLGIPFLIICFPFISLHAFKPETIPAYNRYIYSASYLDRLYIWNEVAQSITDHPWRGIGLDGTRRHIKTSLPRTWIFEGQDGKIHTRQTMRFATHPHNAILQLWLELGIVGLMGGILLAFHVLSLIKNSAISSWERATSNALFINVLVIVWVSLGFWQNWWISGVWMVAGLLLAAVKDDRHVAQALP